MVQEYAKECINAKDAMLIADALKKLTAVQAEKGAYEGDIMSTRIAKEAVDRVLNHASLEHDEICFYVSVGTKKRDMFV